MNVVSHILRTLQGSDGLNLDEYSKCPVGLAPKRIKSGGDFEEYWRNVKGDYKGDLLFELLLHRPLHATRILGWVIFSAALAVAFLAVLALVDIVV